MARNDAHNPKSEDQTRGSAEWSSAGGRADSMEPADGSVVRPGEGDESRAEEGQSIEWSSEGLAEPPGDKREQEEWARPRDGRWQVLETLGRGGMGIVFRCTDTQLGRQVAIKRVFSPNAKALERLRTEARAIAGLSHPNIIQVYDFLEDEAGPYIVMELATGGDLESAIRKHGPLAVERCQEVIAAVTDGLRQAHDHIDPGSRWPAAILHHDIKPSNILLMADGTPKLSDFGLARLGTGVAVTVTGAALGTPAYMAPEQREEAHQVGPEADIYALGKTVYFLLTGETPVTVVLDRLPRQFRGLVGRCLETDPQKRFRTAGHLLDALSGEPVRGASLVEPTEGECPSCGEANPDDLRFCERCGTALTRPCPECERETSIHKQFCGACGTDLNGFDQVRETLQRMRQHRKEKRWGLVAKEFRALPSGFRLTGKKGKESLKSARDLSREVGTMLSARDAVNRQIEDARQEQRFEDALKLVADYQEIDPWNDEVNALPGILQANIDDRDYQNAQEQVIALEESKSFGDAIALLEGYLEEHAQGRHAEEAKEMVSLLRDKLEAQERTRELLEKAEQDIRRAAFRDVEESLREIESLGANEEGAADLKTRLSELRNAYSEAMGGARRARDNRELSEASSQAQKALECCPESSEAKALQEEILRDEKAARVCLLEAVSAAEAALFDQAEEKLAEGEGLWRSVEGLQERKESLGEARAAYEEHMQKARDAEAAKDLGAAEQAVDSAIQRCPASLEAQRTQEAIAQAQATAKGLVESARKLLDAACFAEADREISRAREQWPVLNEFETLQSQLASMKQIYGAHIDSAEAALGKKRFSDARKACENALGVCPDSAEAKRMRQQIQNRDLEERDRKAKRRERAKAIWGAVRKYAPWVVGAVLVMGILASTGLALWSLHGSWRDKTPADAGMVADPGGAEQANEEEADIRADDAEKDFRGEHFLYWRRNLVDLVIGSAIFWAIVGGISGAIGCAVAGESKGAGAISGAIVLAASGAIGGAIGMTIATTVSWVVGDKPWGDPAFRRILFWAFVGTVVTAIGAAVVSTENVKKAKSAGIYGAVGGSIVVGLVVKWLSSG